MFFDGHGYHETSFEQNYQCYPASFIEKSEIECGDKIIMPQSALDRLASLNIDHPMLFELRNTAAERISHCGVLEFIAEEGFVYMPYWMMENLLLREGDTVSVRNVTLPKGSYIKLRPCSKDLLDISNPKAVLEVILRNFSCLTSGDSIMLSYDNKNHYIDVIETKPSHAVSIINTDCEVDFVPLPDSKPPEEPVTADPSSKAPTPVEEVSPKSDPQLSHPETSIESQQEGIPPSEGSTRGELLTPFVLLKEEESTKKWNPFAGLDLFSPKSSVVKSESSGASAAQLLLMEDVNDAREVLRQTMKLKLKDVTFTRKSEAMAAIKTILASSVDLADEVRYVLQRLLTAFPRLYAGYAATYSDTQILTKQLSGFESLTKQISDRRDTFESVQATVSQLEVEIMEKQDQIAKLQAKLRELMEEACSKKQMLDDLTKKIAAERPAIDAAVEEYQVMRSKAPGWEQDRFRKEETLKCLENEWASYQSLCL